MSLRRPTALVAAFLVLSLGGCGGDEPVVAPSPTVAASPTSGSSPTPSDAGFDEEAWRREAIKRFGDEPEFADGSKLNYVDTARALCDQAEYPDYEEGSLQAHILETFCPNYTG